MRNEDPPKTPLLEVLRQCTTEQQQQIADMAGTTRNYLYQLATCQRKSTSVSKAASISMAVTRMHVITLGKVPKISMEEIAEMCACGCS
jgi:DNA-binding Xre family transcriptional regulator